MPERIDGGIENIEKEPRRIFIKKVSEKIPGTGTLDNFEIHVHGEEDFFYGETVEEAIGKLTVHKLKELGLSLVWVKEDKRDNQNDLEV
ncbi:MAG: hypothetical protein M3Q64_00745 [bacterium]|nr:hypothetical protein [bacterium]